MHKKVKSILTISSLFLIFVFLSFKFKSLILLFLSIIILSSFLFLIKKINKNLLLIYFSSLIIIFLIEICLKINFKELFIQNNFKTNKEKIVNYENFQYEITYLGPQLKKGIYKHYLKKGNSFIFDQNYQINNNNFRFNKFIQNTTSKKYNVSFFGDSNTFGWGLSDTETLPYLFYAQNKNYNVFNFGIIGGSPNQTLQMLRNNTNHLGDLNIVFSSAYHLPRIACNRDYSFNSPTFKLTNKELVFDGYCILSFLKFNYQVPRIIGSIVNRSEIIKILNKVFTIEFTSQNIKLYLEILNEINQISIDNNKNLVILYYGSKRTKDVDKQIQTYLIENKIPLINVTFDDQKFFIKNDGHFSKLANAHILNKINLHLDTLNP